MQVIYINASNDIEDEVLRSFAKATPGIAVKAFSSEDGSERPGFQDYNFEVRVSRWGPFNVDPVGYDIRVFLETRNFGGSSEELDEILGWMLIGLRDLVPTANIYVLIRPFERVAFGSLTP